jgi:hypothetical protein
LFVALSCIVSVSNSSDANGIKSDELFVRVKVDAHIAFAHMNGKVVFLKFAFVIFLFHVPEIQNATSSASAKVVTGVSQFISSHQAMACQLALV